MSEKQTNLFYTEDHEWVEKVGENEVKLGITEYAVEQLGDIVFVELPEVESDVKKEDEFATVESVKSSSGIFAPVSGTVSQVNEGLEDEPELMNDSPLEEGWIAVITLAEPFSEEGLLSFEEYQEFLKTVD